jgi:hypothetical protein
MSANLSAKHQRYAGLALAVAVVALIAASFLVAIPGVAASPGAQAARSSTVKTTSISSIPPTSDLVTSVNQNGQQITGYYAVLYSQSGSVLLTGYTPLELTGMSYGQTYMVQVDNYGSCSFSYWQDTGSSVNPRTFTFTQTASGLTFTAVYNCGTSTTSSSSTTSSTSSPSFDLIFDQVNTCPPNTALAGEWLIPWEVSLSNGMSAAQPGNDTSRATETTLGYMGTTNSSYSTIVFQVTDGSYSYTVSPSGSGTLTPGSGSVVVEGSNATVPVDFVPYSCGSIVTSSTSSVATSSSTSSSSSSSGPPSITVESVNQNGQSISGYYTVIRTGTGSEIATGYTAMTFTGLSAGTEYEIELDSYASCTFSHWQDTGSGVDPRTFAAVNGPQTFVGVYNCTSSGALGSFAFLGMAISSISSELSISLAILVVAIGSFAIVRTKTLRIAARNPPI